jgi:glycosyltransferase involved in cell wall biosynthesis
VVAEALSCSLPVLISNKVNIYQEVQNSDAGFISDDEIDGYIFILRKWLSLSEFERIQIRANALSCFQKNFYIKSTVKMLVSTIEGSVN